MLTDAQRQALEAALESKDVQALYEATTDALTFTTLNVQTAAKWLLEQDDEHRAAIRAAVEGADHSLVTRIVNTLRHTARAQGNTVARDAMMDAAHDIQRRYGTTKNTIAAARQGEG